jgi:hypothetical protein
MNETEKALFNLLAETIKKTALPRVTTEAGRELRLDIAPRLCMLQQHITGAIRESK